MIVSPSPRSLPRNFVPAFHMRAGWAGKLNERLFSANAAGTDKSLFRIVQSLRIDSRKGKARVKPALQGMGLSTLHLREQDDFAVGFQRGEPAVAEDDAVH